MERRKDMKYEINGEITIVFDSKGRTFLIDTNQLDKALKYNWYVGARGFVRTASRKAGRVMLHRYLLDTKEQVDHINRDRTDNRLCNLRICTTQENNRNRLGWKQSTSGVKGVTWCKDKKKWRARIGVDGKRISLGYFNTREEAAQAYDEKAVEIFGEYAPHHRQNS